MDHAEIRRIITKVTKDLTPLRLDSEIQKDVIQLVVVSQSFQGTPLSKRFEQLSLAFETHAEELVKKYTLVFQAWTEAEMAEIENDKSLDTRSPVNARSRQAAKPADL